jgi:hypothetical protein
MAYLKEKNVPWQSVSCLGRVSRSLDDKKKIRSTVVIGATTLDGTPEGLSIPDIVRGIQKASGLELPIEFVKGTNELESHFGFKELTNPLVCGASCGNVGKETSSGTIGGFITIEGDPEGDVVYALSNHHVFVGNEQEASLPQFMISQNIKELFTNLRTKNELDQDAIEELAQLCLSCNRNPKILDLNWVEESKDLSALLSK